MARIAHRIACFTADNPGSMTDKGTNQYVLGRDEITVIDVALPSEQNIDGILREAEALGGKKIEKILLTHIHRDHMGGAVALKKRSGAKLGVFRARAGYLGGEDFTYADGETLPYDGGELQIVHTPGHESGHCCFYEARLGVLFTGDHILGRGTTVIPAPDGNMVQYLQSLKKLLPLKLNSLLPGHGPKIDDPYGKINEYIAHRLEREKQVLQALRKGAETRAQIVAEIYTDTPQALWRVAELTVEAHLEKLLEEGRVRREGDRYFCAEGS
ncbi:MAG TPA: MBL fold metallo-hydrolase [Candidatus Acidoferrales bacterium]|nr:MBL fold metallo-hydrolase [Candidatus Acidoferrales bacterium]